VNWLMFVLAAAHGDDVKYPARIGTRAA